jgi:pantothenate synthetase
VETVDFECLEPVENAEGTVLIAIAAYFGATRLIDNTVVQSII